MHGVWMDTYNQNYIMLIGCLLATKAVMPTALWHQDIALVSGSAI